MDLQIKNIFPSEGPSRFNVAAWQKTNRDHVVLVGREVYEPGTTDMPDIGRLVLFEIDEENRIIHERVLWESLHNSLFLEDPRALVHSNSNITIGLTVLIRTDNGFLPYPCVVKVRSDSAWTGGLPPISIIHAFGPGKNLTPIRRNVFLFRPERLDYHHKLLLFNITKNPTESYDIEFPTDLPWALWRIGTTMPPLWVSKNEGILIMHGITIQEGKYIYSIGRALLRRKKGKFQIIVHPDPLITPDTFTSQKLPQIKELHPELRRVVYACGGVIKRKDPNNLYLYVNVGDSSTFEVKIALSELKGGLL